MKLYTVYDVVAKEAGPVWTAKNDDIACRQFKKLLTGEDVTNPEDFHLYRVADYDPETMIISPEREQVTVKINIMEAGHVSTVQ